MVVVGFWLRVASAALTDTAQFVWTHVGRALGGSVIVFVLTVSILAAFLGYSQATEQVVLLTSAVAAIFTYALVRFFWRMLAIPAEESATLHAEARARAEAMHPDVEVTVSRQVDPQLVLTVKNVGIAADFYATAQILDDWHPDGEVFDRAVFPVLWGGLHEWVRIPQGHLAEIILATADFRAGVDALEIYGLNIWKASGGGPKSISEVFTWSNKGEEPAVLLQVSITAEPPLRSSSFMIDLAVVCKQDGIPSACETDGRSLEEIRLNGPGD